MCSDQGLGIIPYNPLAGGVLTGKYKRNIKLPEGSRLDVFQPYRDRYLTESTLDIVDRFLEAAKKIGVTPAQLALAWVMGETRVTAPILGARNLQQLRDSLKGVKLRLTPEQRARIPTVAPRRWVGKRSRIRSILTGDDKVTQAANCTQGFDWRLPEFHRLCRKVTQGEYSRTLDAPTVGDVGRDESGYSDKWHKNGGTGAGNGI